MRGKRLNPNSLIKTLGKIIVSAGLLAFLLTRISLGSVVEQIGGLDPRVCTLAVAVFFLSNVISSWQWHQLLVSSGVSLPFHRAFRFYFVGLFFNNFLPANIGGDAVKVYDVTRLGSSAYQVIAVTLLDRLIGIFSLCLIASFCLLFLLKVFTVGTLLGYLAIFVGCMTPVLGFYFIEPLGKILRRLVGRMKLFSISARGTSILDNLGEFKSRKPLILKLIFVSIVIQALRVSTHILIAVALGVQLDGVAITLFFVFVPLLSLAMIPPITINGLGVREGLGILLFAQAGIGQTDAFTIEFLTYLVSVSVSLLGLIFFLMRREGRREPTPDSTAI
ncbi:MAG: lysylphosphatidylglycerol synthase transmembrane domain-containing protein [bacterium]|nr:lysylphosphatidylglycerol synthase transmembrane domain-containing protein [bacterium]